VIYRSALEETANGAPPAAETQYPVPERASETQRRKDQKEDLIVSSFAGPYSVLARGVSGSEMEIVSVVFTDSIPGLSSFATSVESVHSVYAFGPPPVCGGVLVYILPIMVVASGPFSGSSPTK